MPNDLNLLVYRSQSVISECWCAADSLRCQCWWDHRLWRMSVMM